MAKHCVFATVILLFSLFYSRCFALSIQPQPNLSNTTTLSVPSNSISLYQNVQNLIVAIRHSPDPRISTAPLIAVYAFTAGGMETTTDVSALRRLEVMFRPRIPPEGGYKEFLVINNDPNNYAHWLPPTKELAQEHDPEREIQWEEVNQLMNIHEADRLLKAAGYRGRFVKAMVALWMGYPLSWCFGYEPPLSVRVNLLTREVVEEIHGC